MSSTIADAHRLTSTQGLFLTVASTAPWYSIAVTAPLIVALVGVGAPLAYALAAIPAFGIAWGMAANDRRHPDKGTVYTWGRSLDGRFGWFAGFCLASTGIIATAGLAYVAASLILPAGTSIWLTFALALALIALATGIDLVSLRAMSMLQGISVVTALLAGAWAVWLLVSGQLALPPVAGGAPEWLQAILLAVFAYWGFDAIFALTDQTERGNPTRVSIATMVTLATLFVIASLAMSSPDASLLIDNAFVRVAVILSAVMSLGSTIIPTARGIESMAEAGQLPAARPLSGWQMSTIATALLAAVWALLLLISPELFDDTIEALSVFVGIYFSISSWVAYRAGEGAVHLVSAVVMALITGAVMLWMFTPGYGTLTVGGIGAVGVIVLVILVVGLAGAMFWGRRGTPARG